MWRSVVEEDEFQRTLVLFIAMRSIEPFSLCFQIFATIAQTKTELELISTKL